MSEVFSGRVYRLANNTYSPDWFRELFILGLGDETEGEWGRVTRIFADATHRWVIDVVPFEDAPKIEPAMLYRRHIRTAAAEDRFRSDCFDGRATKPSGSAPLPRGAEPLRGVPRWSVEWRSMVLQVEAEAFKAEEGDPWFDVRYSYEHYGARVLIKVPDGFEESIWFLSGGFEADPAPRLTASVEARAAKLDGHVVAIDGPSPTNNTGHIGTGTILSKVFHHVASGADEFEARLVTLTAWN